MRMCHFFWLKMTHLFRTNSFWYKPLLLLSVSVKENPDRKKHLSIDHFHCAKFKKNSYNGYEDVPFLGLEWSICPKQKIFWKIFDIIFIYEDAQFLGPKWPFCPYENFFRKPVNEPCSFDSCLSICEKSKSDINLLMKF